MISIKTKPKGRGQRGRLRGRGENKRWGKKEYRTRDAIKTRRFRNDRGKEGREREWEGGRRGGQGEEREGRRSVILSCELKYEFLG